MFDLLLYATAAVALLGVCYAYRASGDVLHPLMFTGPMFLFLYAWMPLKLHWSGSLEGYFLPEQLLFVQTVNFLGVLAFVSGCLWAGVPGRDFRPLPPFMPAVARRLRIGATVTGCIGLTAWLTLIIRSGGPVQAFGKAYSGGWDDSGYVRDGSILLLSALLLLLIVIGRQGWKASSLGLLLLFTTPWLIQAILTSRRGPTFALTIVLCIGWFLNRNRRPSLPVVTAGGMVLGYLILFLVVNRSEIYLGSDFDFKTDVFQFVETPDTGNEYIYGSGSLLSAERRGKYFWGRRCLAQILVRPVPTAVWPTKYEDFGVPELLHNAGTDEGIGDALGWQGAPGSAPGIIADLWVEGSWGAIPALGFFGWLYGTLWRRATQIGSVWTAQYGVAAALSIYFVMQTMEAVIFRSLLLSIPVWLVWNWSRRAWRPLPEIDFEEQDEMAELAWDEGR